jgi:hypothetical protein
MKRIVLSLVLVGVLAGGADAARLVRMQVSVPGVASPQLVVEDGGGFATVVVNDARFAFEATTDPNDSNRVRVVIYAFDGQQRTQIDDITVINGGEAVASNTAPEFRIRILRIYESQ